MSAGQASRVMGLGINEGYSMHTDPRVKELVIVEVPGGQ